MHLTYPESTTDMHTDSLPFYFCSFLIISVSYMEISTKALSRWSWLLSWQWVWNLFMKTLARCRLGDVMTFFCCELCLYSRCSSKHPTVWIQSTTVGLSDDREEPRIKQGAIQRGGVRMTSIKITFISNMCLCLPPSSSVSLWQRCAVFPAACFNLIHYQLMSLHLTQSRTGCAWPPQVPPAVSVQVLAWTSPFLNEASVFVFEGWNRSALFPAPDTFVFAQWSDGYRWAVIRTQTNLAQLNFQFFSHLPCHGFLPLVSPPSFDISFLLPLKVDER